MRDVCRSPVLADLSNSSIFLDVTVAKDPPGETRSKTKKKKKKKKEEEEEEDTIFEEEKCKDVGSMSGDFTCRRHEVY